MHIWLLYFKGLMQNKSPIKKTSSFFWFLDLGKRRQKRSRATRTHPWTCRLPTAPAAVACTMSLGTMLADEPDPVSAASLSPATAKQRGISSSACPQSIQHQDNMKRTHDDN